MDLLNYHPGCREFLQPIEDNICVIECSNEERGIVADAIANCLFEAGLCETLPAASVDQVLGNESRFSTAEYFVVCIDISRPADSRCSVYTTEDKLCLLSPHYRSMVKVLEWIQTIEKKTLVVAYNGEIDEQRYFDEGFYSRLERIAVANTNLVLRVSEVISPPSCHLLKSWKNELLRGQCINPAQNRYVSPVHIDDVVLSACALVANREFIAKDQSVWSLASPDSVSYASIAFYLADQIRVSNRQVKPVNNNLKFDALRQKGQAGVSVSCLLQRPNCKALTAIERILASQLRRPVCADKHPSKFPFKLGFVEKISAIKGKELFYEKLFFSPSAGYLTRQLGEKRRLSSLPYENEMIRLSHNYVDNNGKISANASQVIRAYCRGLFQFTRQAFSGFIQAVNQRESANVSIVFITMQWNSKLLAEASSLRKCGKRCFLIVLNGGDIPVRKDFEGVFEQVLEVPEACMALFTVLIRNLRPSVYHIFSNMFFNYVSWVVVANSRNAKTVIDYDDYLLLNGREGFFDSLVADNVQSLDYEVSYLLLKYADKHLLPFAPYGVEWLEEIHPSVGSKAQTFFNWPSDDQAWPVRSASHSRPRKTPKLVWAGNVWAYNENTRKFFFSSGLIESIQQLVNSGCEVDVLLDPHKNLSMDDPAWEPYFLLEKTGRFKFKKGVMATELPDVLADYDFGLLHLSWNSVFEYAYPQKFEYSVPNKLFAYLSAGLPVLVSSEMAYQSWLIDHFGLGLVQGKFLDEDIRKQLYGFDYEGFRIRLEEFCRQNCMTINLSRVLPEYA